eukprot:CAMPEP_0171098388 /NCGR_PEP_ID=MMETSP0766_2-20121228/48113_1 /TAXON_ID=439317 /ORGANISM="Gambierdiscus australes, Strain CAWD 149" /LENGTH=48 /DNA_ID= /DNA_START= /DNA_END= /DNA_ORIENTATION=
MTTGSGRGGGGGCIQTHAHPPPILYALSRCTRQRRAALSAAECAGVQS